MDLSLRSSKTNNWPADNFKNKSPQRFVHLSPRYSHVTLVSRCLFDSCQLNITYIYMLFTGWEVRIRRNCARGLEYRPRPKAKGTVSPNTDRPRPVNNIFIFFLLRFKSFRKTSASNLCVLKKAAFVLMLIQSARSIANQNKT